MRVDFQPSSDLYPFESRWLDSSVGPVHYIDEGGGRPFLFLHGNPTWSFLYREIIRDLREDVRCIALDFPGFGLSTHPSDVEYTPGQLESVVAECVASLDLDDLVIMGQDWGGPVGLGVARRHPDRVRGFVMGNTWCGPIETRLVRLASWAVGTSPMRWAVLERNAFVERVLPFGTRRSLDSEIMRHYRAVLPRADFRTGVAQLPRQLREADAWLASLRDDVDLHLSDRPLLLTWGMRDPMVTAKAFIPQWTDIFDDHRVLELPDASHFIQEDAPESIAAGIRERFVG
jgi:haloalkane dehalogenase